jgi:outer membrane protein OmpA-like peptidoglycan-associated protein
MKIKKFNLSKKSVNLLKTISCRIFWFLFVGQALVIIYLLAPKPVEPIITLTQDFASLTGPNIVREGETTAEYTITLKKDVKQDLNITLGFSGTAEFGLDYNASTTVVMKQGELSKTFTIETIDDPLAEFNEEFAVKIMSVEGESFMDSYTISHCGGVVYTKILDEKSPKNVDEDSVSIEISGAKEIYEDEQELKYSFVLSQVAVDDIDLKLEYKGTAQNGVDYIAPEHFVIKKGQKEASFTIKPINDTLKEVDDIIKVNIVGIEDIGFEDIRYESAYLEIELLDEKVPTKDFVVSLDADKNVKEGELITYTITSQEAAPEDIALRFKIDANDANSYEEFITAVLHKGEKAVRFKLKVADDNFVESKQDISLVLDNVDFSTHESVKVTVLNNKTQVEDNNDATEVAQVSLSLYDVREVLEDMKRVKIIVQSTQTLQEDTKFQVSYSGVAKYAQDYTVDKEVVIEKGSDRAIFSLEPIDDNKLEGAESLTLSIATDSQGGLEKLEVTGALNITIDDEERRDDAQSAFVSLIAPKSVSEPEKTANYTLSISQVPSEDVEVKLFYKKSSATSGLDFEPLNHVVIKKGTQKANFKVQTLDDNEAENVEEIVVEIDTISGGGLESIQADENSYRGVTALTDEKDIAQMLDKIARSKKVIFKRASSDVSDESLVVLEEIANLLKKFPRANLIVEGHTNKAGSRTRNLALSKRRANSVKSYFIKLGIDKSRLKAVGYGQDKPMVPYSNPDAMELNKRVAFKIKYKGI